LSATDSLIRFAPSARAMPSRPKISVLIPTCNYARFLPEAIESVLAQDFADFELLIADDASTDDSADVIHRYAAADARIRVHRHPHNLGMVANWNWCLREARGEYVKFLFGDDRLAVPQALRRLAALLDAHPQATLAVSARRLIDEHSRPGDVWDQFAEEGLYDGRHVGRQCLLATHNFIGEPTAVMLRATAATAGFDERYRQIVDLELWCRLLLAGALVYTREPLCDFRWHSAQQTKINRGQNLGGAEYMQLLHDYLPRFVPAGFRPRSSLRPLLFRSIYDCRKMTPPSAEAHQVAESLLRILGRRGYLAAWLRHRLARPASNLHRLWRKHLRRETVESHRPAFALQLEKS
jgi:glycosyltransferase involved in cell wall biosynthesis